MFGLTLEKLVLVAVVAMIIIGPRRSGEYARRLTQLVRSLRGFVETTTAKAEQEIGVPLRREDWRALDLRQYDPRRIVREALADAEEAVQAPVVVEMDTSRIRPGQKYLVTGPSSHPRRILIEALPDDDPRRIAARPLEAASEVSAANLGDRPGDLEDVANGELEDVDLRDRSTLVSHGDPDA